MARQKIRKGINFEWASSNWTHNIFRFYEVIFGRAYGKNGVGDTIRAEMTSWVGKDGISHHAAHTFEAACALIETYIRDYLKSWRFAPFKLYIPVLQTPSGFPIMSPYLFAIAIDATTQNYTGTASATLTVTHTATGSNRFAAFGILIQMNSGTNPGFSACTYDSVAMTVTSNSPTSNAAATVGETALYLFLQASPTTTASANVVFTANLTMDGDYGAVVSYSGAQSTSVADSVSKTVNAGAANNVLTTTTVADNCWTVAFWRCEIGGAVAGTGTTMRYNNGDGGIGDSNAALTPAGSKSMTYTFASAPSSGLIASFAPFGAVAAGGHNLSSLGAGT